MRKGYIVLLQLLIIALIIGGILFWHTKRMERYKREEAIIEYIIDSDSYNRYTYNGLVNMSDEELMNELYIDKFFEICNYNAIDVFIKNKQYLNYMYVVENLNIVETNVKEIKMINDRSGADLGEDISNSVHKRTYTVSYEYKDSNGKNYDLLDMFYIYTDGDKITYILNKYTHTGVQKQFMDLIY